MIALEVFAQGKFITFRVTGLIRIQVLLHHPPRFFLAALPRFATANHKFVARLAVASVVIRAAN